MALKTTPFDPADYLDNPESIEAYLSEALRIAQEDSDPGFLADALGIVARARGMSQIASAAGLSRESLYKALREDANPEFATILRVFQALGLQLTVTQTPAA